MRISDWSSDVCSSDLVGQGGGTRRRVHVAVMGAAARAPKPLRQRRNCVSLAVTRRRAPAFCPPLVPVSPPPAQASRLIDHPLFYLAAVPAVLIAGLPKGGFGPGLGRPAVPLMPRVRSETS